MTTLRNVTSGKEGRKEGRAAHFFSPIRSLQGRRLFVCREFRLFFLLFISSYFHWPFEASLENVFLLFLFHSLSWESAGVRGKRQHRDTNTKCAILGTASSSHEIFSNEKYILRSSHDLLFSNEAKLGFSLRSDFVESKVRNPGFPLIYR